MSGVSVARKRRVTLRARRGEHGFTLIELLVVIVILGLITIPLLHVFFGYLRSSDATNALMTESHDVQIASAYWAQDVAATGTRATTDPYALTQSVETGVAYNSGLYPCGPSGTPNAIVRIAWDDYSITTGPVRVAYVVTNGGTTLHRLTCKGTSTAVDVVLAHDLDPANAPVLSCSTTCTAAPLVPATMTLTLTLKDPKSVGAAWSATLTGQRRQTS